MKGGLFPSSEALLRSKRRRRSHGWAGRACTLGVQLLDCIRVIRGAVLKLGRKGELSITELQREPRSALERQCQPIPSRAGSGA